MLATVLSAVAGLAAVLAGLNLYLSGRREHVRWAREALVDAFVSFLSASFQSKDYCKEASRLARAGVTGKQVDALLVGADGAHDEMLGYLTRLRLLSGSDVVDAALALRRQNEHYLELVSDAAHPVAPEEDEDARRRLLEARELLVRAAKKAMAIP